MVCYNFMPVFDWTRSDLAKPRPDGSTVLSYDQEIIDQMDPDKLFGAVDAKANGFVLPGWEPERLAHIRDLFALYEGVTPEKLFDNLVYFLNAIMPVCDRYDIRMAIHPDDPAFSVFGLPRIITGGDAIKKMLDAVPNVHNGVTLCTGSLASNPKNDIPAIIRPARWPHPFRARTQRGASRARQIRRSCPPLFGRLAGYVCHHESAVRYRL